MTGVTQAHQTYRGDSGRAYHEGKRALDPRALNWLCRARAERFQPYIQPDHHVLEFGVGAGWNLLSLSCRRRVGIDVQCFLAEGWERQGIEFESTTTPFPVASFDAIICHHALEHVENPAGVLVELRRLLKPGGKLLLAVPYEPERRYRHYDVAEPNHHLFSWNAQSLGRLVSVCGWQILEIGLQRYGYDRLAANTSARWRLGESGFRIVRRLLQLLRPLREVVIIAYPAV